MADRDGGSLSDFNSQFMRFIRRVAPYYGCLLLLLFSLVTCAPEQPNNEGDAHDLAIEMIEEGNYNTAIQLMSDLLAKDPHNERARVIIASAYAAKAGIFLKNYTDFAQEVIQSSSESQRIIEERADLLYGRLRNNAHNDNELALIDVFERLHRAVLLTGDVLSGYEKLPALRLLSQYEDVVRAIAVLEPEDDTGLSKGPVLYRGLLRLAQFKYNVENHYRIFHLNICTIDLKGVEDDLIELKNDLHWILSDFANGSASPARKEQLDKLAGESDQFFAEAIEKTNFLEKLPALDVSSIVAAVGGRCQ